MQKKYAIVKREKEKDVLIGTVKAGSFEEAEKIANKQYSKEKQSLVRGNAWLVVELVDEVVFDAENRIVNTSGNMNMYYKF